MKTSVILLLLLPLVPGPARAQGHGREPEQAIAGAVVEDSTRVPIAGAVVTALRAATGAAEAAGAPARARTDSLGRFRLPLDSAGRFRLRAEQPGYRTVETDTVSVGEDEVLTVELRMARQAIPLEPLVVTARVDRQIADFYGRVRKNVFGHFLTRAQIEQRPGQRPTELIRMMPGVRIVGVSPCRGCRAENVLFLRGVGPGGSNQCSPTVLVDGMEVKQDVSSPLDDMVMTDMLEGVEIYTEPGTAPPDFAIGRGDCGVVAFWTRRPQGKFSWKKILISAGLGLAFYLIFLR